MAVTIKTIAKPGVVLPQTFVGGVAVKANDVILDTPTILGQGQVLYGLEVKRDLFKRYYKRTEVQAGDISGAKNKGVLGAWMYLHGRSQDEPLEIHDCGQDGVFIASDYVRVEWTHISKLGNPGLAGTATPHADGIQVTAGTGHVFANCHFELPHIPEDGFNSNSCVYIESDFGPIGTVDINGCILDGGLYSLFAVVGKYGPPKKVTLRNCTFKRARYASLNWKVESLPSWLELINCKGMK